MSGETKLFKKPCQAGLCLKRKTGGYTSAEWDQHARDTITFSTELWLHRLSIHFNVAMAALVASSKLILNPYADYG